MRIISNKLCAVSVVLLSFLSASCSTYNINEGVEPGLRVSTPGTEAQLNNVGFLTDRLNARVAVERTGGERTPTNTLRVWCLFRNRTDYQQKIVVRTQYFDAGRSPNSPPTAWKHVYLEPNAHETYEAYSETTDAEYYYIEVKELL